MFWLFDKQGPKVKESDPNSPYNIKHAGEIMFQAGPGLSGIKGSITIARLARSASGALAAPVEDLTGLKGKYDIDISWVPDRPVEAQQPESAGVDDIFGSFQKTLGLKLERRKVSVDFLVIDHIERIPTEN